MTPPDDLVRHFRRQLAAVLTLKYSLAALTAWAFVWGTAVLVLRAALNVPAQPLLWGLAVLPLLAVWVTVQVRRRLPAASAVRALVDYESGYGGVLMASAERDLDGWLATLPRPADLRVSWSGRRPATLFAVAAAFLLASFLLPQQLTAGLYDAPLEVGKEVERLSAQVELLKEEKILEPERAETLQQKLKQVQDDASGVNPVKTLEALDHVNNLTHKAAQEAAESAVAKTERLTKAETLAEALHQAGGELDPQVLTEAMKELAKMTEKAGEEEIDQEALDAAKAGKLTPAQLKQLAKGLRAGKGKAGKLLDKLIEAKLIDAELKGFCDKCGQCKGGELARFLKECNGNCSLEDLLCACNRPGRGGVTRGRGDAEMAWGKESSEEGVKWKEQALPPAARSALKDNQMAGVSRAAPAPEKGGESSRPGALQGGGAGGSANTQVILPRHRGAVERYFERSSK